MTTLIKALSTQPAMNAVPNQFGRSLWRSIIEEPFSGAWQRNMPREEKTLLAQSTVFACMTLIAGDVSKLPWMIESHNRKFDIWETNHDSLYGQLLRRPNNYQTTQQFLESWLLSKLKSGNTYVLKGRNQRGVVERLWVLSPDRVQPLVTDLGDVYYRVNKDPLSDRYADEAIIPASEIIHDRYNTLFHPLVGLSPLFAAAVAAGHNLAIQEGSTNFFDNGAKPSGILVAPGPLNPDKARELSAHWNESFSGQNAGRIAVIGDGMKFETMSMTSSDSQLVEQLKWTAEVIASVFHVPGYKVGVGQEPTYNNIGARQQQYLSETLQTYIKAIEDCMTHGLDLDFNLRLSLDEDELTRMDTAGLMESEGKAVKDSLKTIDEARRRVSLPPMPGGSSIWMQQQNYSLEALAERDRLSNLPPIITPVVEPQTTVVIDEVNDKKSVDERDNSGFKMLLSLSKALDNL